MTYERPQATLRKRATRAIIENAIFDWKSGVVIALTILFTAFSPISEGWRWFYLAGGVVMWGALFALLGYLLYSFLSSSGRGGGSGGGFSGGSFGGGFSGGGGASGSW